MAMLLEHFSKYASAQSHDGADLLRTWKEASSQLFKAVEHITSYRRFLIIGDDGMLELGPVDPPLGAVGGFPDAGDFFQDSELLEQVSKLTMHSLPKVVESVLSGGTAGSVLGLAEGRCMAKQVSQCACYQKM